MGSFKKDIMKNFAELTRNYLNRNPSLVFLVNFAKFARTTFLQNNTGRLFLIIMVSTVAKGVLANETVNYESKACINLSQKCKLL